MTNTDYFDWTPIMIYARIHEVENEIDQLRKGYCDRINDLLAEREQLYKAVSKDVQYHENEGDCEKQ